MERMIVNSDVARAKTGAQAAKTPSLQLRKPSRFREHINEVHMLDSGVSHFRRQLEQLKDKDKEMSFANLAVEIGSELEKAARFTEFEEDNPYLV